MFTNTHRSCVSVACPARKLDQLRNISNSKALAVHPHILILPRNLPRQKKKPFSHRLAEVWLVGPANLGKSVTRIRITFISTSDLGTKYSAASSEEWICRRELTALEGLWASTTTHRRKPRRIVFSQSAISLRRMTRGCSIRSSDG